MGVKIPDAVKDVLLDHIADTGDILHACSGEPGNYAAIAGVTLGNIALTEGDGNGDYTKGDGDTSGRKLTLAMQTITGTDDGDATHLVIADSVAEVIKAITTCNAFTISTGVDFDLAAYDVVEVRDAALS